VCRVVASMYSLGGGGVGQKLPTNEKNSRIFRGIRSQEGVCYPENEDAIYKQKYAYFAHRYITEACSAVGSSFWLGGLKAGAEASRKVLNLEIPGLWGKFWQNSDGQKTAF
jgi:hypothetical protein